MPESLTRFNEPQLQFHPFAAVLALALGLHGFRKGSLSLDGAVAAFISGYLTLGNELRVFGVALIVFYLIGSRATKVGALCPRQETY